MELAVQNVVWVKVPYSNGQVLHVPTGRFMHENRDFAKRKKKDPIKPKQPIGSQLENTAGHSSEKVSSDQQCLSPVQQYSKKNKPPDVLLKCHEVWRGGGFTKEIVLKYEHTWSIFYELLEEEFGEKVVFDYQDRGGRMVTVDDHEKFERFCEAVDDATLPKFDNTNRKYGTEINVYVRPYSSETQLKVKGGMENQQAFTKGQSAQAIARDGADMRSGAMCFQARCTIS